ncbi:C-type lectin domain family 2 member D11-like isoform X3 [Cervus elaphus]|uniref:C-type lectin domain family 2 member D11-like isoform X3 n=1 Tax=Cervus elaphus TaxID=9860 RepID=UPI001CC2F8CC|nr:C-type lectin domain family 2 member D11-like isoform X3 [Cervus elaphus]
MLFLKHDRNMTTTEVSLKILETDPTCRANEEAWRSVSSRKPDSHVLYVLCPKGWIGFGCKCFNFSEDSKNWTFSQTFCTSREAVLAQFETEEELNFLKRYKGPFDHWIGLSRESSHHAWKWTDNSTYNTSFGMTGDGERGYLNDLGVSSARSYTERKWICSKQITSPCP